MVRAAGRRGFDTAEHPVRVPVWLRPPQVHRVRATILLGQVVAFEHRVAGEALDLQHGWGEILTASAVSFPR